MVILHLVTGQVIRILDMVIVLPIAASNANALAAEELLGQVASSRKHGTKLSNGWVKVTGGTEVTLTQTTKGEIVGVNVLRNPVKKHVKEQKDDEQAFFNVFDLLLFSSDCCGMWS